MIVLCIGCLLFGKCMIAKENEKVITEQVEQPEPLVIDIPEPATTGTITLYEPDGSIYFQYSGDFIKVQNSGKNGEDIKISVYLPVNSKCNCFKEGDQSD